jgi:biofilm PGA synthesis N-glycosyltransferase PgaC
MQPWQYIFLIASGLVFYNYAGYALLAWLFTKLAGKYPFRPTASDRPPGVTFIVAAYNEADWIEEKLRNSLELNYPADAIEFLFVTDGSTDDTPAIVSRHPRVRLLHEPPRKGKAAAMNRAVQAATHDILIFSDANTTLNKDAIGRIVRHYADPRTGGVAGEKKVVDSTTAGTAAGPGSGEGLYWKYESRLKQIDSDFYSVVGAAGELFSLRRTLYQPMSENTILDDFVLSLKVADQGYRILYEPDAFARETPSFSLREEQKRKIRIAAGGFQSIGMLLPLLAFWRHPRLSYLYISHRVLRWAVSPLCLILALVSSAFSVGDPAAHFYQLCFAAQVLFYSLAALYSLHLAGPKLNKICKIPYYFIFMNVSVILGFIRFCKGRQSGVWEKAKRAQAVPD